MLVSLSMEKLTTFILHNLANVVGHYFWKIGVENID